MEDGYPGRALMCEIIVPDAPVGLLVIFLRNHGTQHTLATAMLI